MSVLAFDFYAEDDPNGTALGTLDDTQCKGMEWRVALDELGAGKFTISRHHTAATSTLIRENNLVKVRIPSVSEDPIFAFWLKEGDFTLIDNREQGGEDLTFGGPGVLYVLSLARLNEEFYAPSQDFRGNSPDIPGMWRWYTEPYGAILTRGIEEGQNQPGEPLEDVTIRVTAGFEDTRLYDSNGDAWPNIEEDFQTPIGTDVLTLAERISVAGDLLLVGEPDLTIGLYQDYGRTLTGAFGASTVRFQKGINILTQLKRQIKARAMLTHLIQRDKDGEYTTEVSPAYSAGDRAHYGFFEAGQTNDTAQLAKMGQNIMASSLTSGEAHELEITPGFDPANGRYMPGPDGTDGHFWIGDRVTLHTGTGEHDFNAASQIVVAIRVVLDEASDDSTDDTAARSLHIVPELNYREVRGFASEGIQPAEIGQPGFCCGPPVCTGTTVGGGEELLNFDWQEAPDNEETIPAIAGLSQPAITLGSTENPAIIPGDYYYAMHDRDDAVYVFTAVDPGDEIVVSLQYSTGQHWSVRDIEPLVLEWVSGSYTGAALGYTTLSVNELELTYSPNVLRSGAISATAPGSAVGLRLAKDSAGTTLAFFVHALIVTSGGTVIECPPNSVSPHDHTHDEFHTIHTVEALATTETDTDLRLAPDGAGGVEWGTGGGAPDDATYLVTTAQAGLSAEIVVGATPGGELGGTWASPTVDATHSGSTHSAATDTHIADATDAHDASAISFSPTGTIAATDVQAAIAEVAAEAGGSGAPTTVNYLVGTADAGLSAEIVVGTTPGGELGGTWASPTVDATHSGSTHSASTDTHIADASDAHDASAISIVDAGGYFAATEVEAGLQELAAAGGTGGPGSDWDSIKTQAADQDVTNSAALVDSTNLVIGMLAGEVAMFEGVNILSQSDAAADIDWQYGVADITAAQKAVGAYRVLSTTGAALTGDNEFGDATNNTWPNGEIQMDAGTALGDYRMQYVQFLVHADAAGDVVFRFANRVAGVGDTSRLHSGSMLRKKILKAGA